MEKTTVFNLIILDESGSMSSVTKQTIDGCNETLNLIRSLEKAHGDTQRNLASIYVFQTNPDNQSHYIVKNRPIGEVTNVTGKDYNPWGSTPLLDAVGSTLVDLEAVASTHQDATGTVTIITDGYENSSTDYTWTKVAAIISRMKERGWTFNFIGANIDVEAVSKKMNIDNSLAFNNDEAGTHEMFACFNEAYLRNEESRICAEESMPDCSMDERIEMRKKHAQDFFN